MVNIDYIMGLLDWNNSSEDQSRGIQLSRDVKCINAFLQPSAPYGKRVWDNCAIILSERSDKELTPYLVLLMEWLEDMNWPGAFCILERLKGYEKNQTFNLALNTCIKYAKAVNNIAWENILRDIM